MSREIPVGATVLAALFVTALVTAQLTAAKLLGFEIPFTLPFSGDLLILPGAALAYALTFFASDCYTELYGKRPAQAMVNVAFLMNFVLLALVYSTVAAPAAPTNAVDPAAYRAVLLQSTNIVAASLLAFLISQNWDVLVFHYIRELTGPGMLWLRNLASTASSQLLDTVIFVGVAFYLLPQVGIGPSLPVDVVLGLMVGQYVLKLLIAVADTPFVYAVTAFVRRNEAGHADPLLDY